MTKIEPRNVTEFSYRYSAKDRAVVYLSFQVPKLGISGAILASRCAVFAKVWCEQCRMCLGPECNDLGRCSLLAAYDVLTPVQRLRSPSHCVASHRLYAGSGVSLACWLLPSHPIR